VHCHDASQSIANGLARDHEELWEEATGIIMCYKCLTAWQACGWCAAHERVVNVSQMPRDSCSRMHDTPCGGKLVHM
jgi:hypothetical protein